VVVAWVIVKNLAWTTVELLRAALRFVADPLGEVRGWRWLTIQLGFSVWIRGFFTMAACRDLDAGIPSVYVNYLDYDVAAHAFGPRDRRALRTLRRVDSAIHQLWRVLRRVPEHQYDLYVLADHGCRMIAPVLDELAAEMAGRVRFAKLNVDENPGTAARFGVQSIPTLLVLQKGREIDRIVGVQSKAEIARRLQRVAT
jgi:thioredoxin